MVAYVGHFMSFALQIAEVTQPFVATTTTATVAATTTKPISALNTPAAQRNATM